MKKGFTLVELLVTLVIIALLGGIGIISYQSFFNIGKEKYYSTLESGILLAGNDYYLDHRDKLPSENSIEKISISDLEEGKYIEPVKDSKGNACTTGYVYAYRSNNKYNYEVCLECEDGYKSSGKYCNSEYSAQITITGRTASGANYNVLNSYNETLYTNNENVIVTFTMNKTYFKVKKYDVIDTKNKGIVLTSCNTDSNASCYVTITNSGTYEVKAYDEDNQLIAANQQFNVRIAKNGPRYTIKGGHRFEISKSNCSNNNKTKNITFKIIKDNINEEYKSVKYCVKRLENTNECTKNSDYQSNNSLNINLSLGSGAYILKVIVSNFVDEETVVEHDFDIMYTIDLKYEDGDPDGTHKVVTGQNYNYLSTKYNDISTLPTRKRSYGVDNLEIRWHLDGEEYEESKRITGSTIVTNDCTYTISGLTSIPIDKPTTEYCTNPTYTGSSQSLTKAMEHVTFLDKDQIDAGTYTVEAQIDSPYYIWKDDWDFENKPITCSMARANVSFPSCNSQTYTSSPITLFAAHSSGVGYTNSAISGTNVNTYSGNLTPDRNHKWTDTGGTGARSLSCSITPKAIGSCPGSPAVKTYDGSYKSSGITCPTGASAGGDTGATNAGNYSQTCTGSGNYTGSCSVSWSIKISCSAGYYLPANSQSCTGCTNGNYCPGITNVLKSNSNQGLNGCPSGYGNSDGARTSNANCYASGTNYECQGHTAYDSCNGTYVSVGGYWAYGNFAGDSQHGDAGYSYTGYKCLENTFVCGNGISINKTNVCYLYRHNNCYGQNWSTHDGIGFSHCDCRAEVATTPVACKTYYGTSSCI